MSMILNWMMWYKQIMMILDWLLILIKTILTIWVASWNISGPSIRK